MNDRIKNIAEYMSVVVSAFARKFSMSNAAAYKYLRKFSGIDFLLRQYDVEHTFSIDDAIEDLCEICKRKGGSLSL